MNNNLDLNKIPKQFCENITIGFSPEFFTIVTHLGATVAAYSLTPQHMKRLAQYAVHNVAEFEKKFGKINAEWNAGVQSPIQVSDLNHPGSSKGDEKK